MSSAVLGHLDVLIIMKPMCKLKLEVSVVLGFELFGIHRIRASGTQCAIHTDRASRMGPFVSAFVNVAALCCAHAHKIWVSHLPHTASRELVVA